jgi:hypothetical protein
MIKKLLVVLVALVAAALAAGWPDITRFVQMRRISATGDPALVPAEGRSVYPATRAGATPDGTGDFDSARRGGPATNLIRAA